MGLIFSAISWTPLAVPKAMADAKSDEWGWSHSATPSSLFAGSTEVTHRNAGTGRVLHQRFSPLG